MSAAFAQNYDAGAAQLLTRKIIDDLITPVGAMLRIGPERKNCFLLESVQGGDWRGRYSMIGMDPDMIWQVRDGVASCARNGGAFETEDARPIDALRDFLSVSKLDIPPHFPGMVAGVFGFLGYDMVRQVEHLPAINPDTLNIPDALLIRPTLMAVFDAVAQEIILATPVRPTPQQDAQSAYDAAQEQLDRLEQTLASPLASGGVKQAINEDEPSVDLDEMRCNTAPDQYRDMVDAAKTYIRQGDIFQVVPSQRFSMPLRNAPFSFYRALRRMNPSPFLYYLNFDDFCVIGSSPEILVRLNEQKVTIRPIAGTRPRGANRAEDLANEADLLADQKERAEHLMLLDLGRNDVGRVCAPGSMRVTESYGIERYSHVMHIVSNVEGTLAADKDCVDALFAGFPAGTVSGAPKVRAMQIIDELEVNKRGLYAGAIGYFSANGDMDTCIALRTAIIKDGVMHVQAGGGVVLDSDPESERMETIHKSRALFRAAAQSWRFTA